MTLIYLFSLLTFGCLGAQLESAQFVDNEKVDGHPLVINGVGLRTATWLRVKVYAAALYTEKKASEVQAIVDQPYKKLTMQFLRDVDKQDIAAAWDHSYKENCVEKCEVSEPLLIKLKESMVNVKEGDRMDYVFAKDSVKVFHNASELTTLKSPSFAKNLILTWLGKNPPTEDLKRGLLGIENK